MNKSRKALRLCSLSVAAGALVVVSLQAEAKSAKKSAPVAAVEAEEVTEPMNGKLVVGDASKTDAGLVTANGSISAPASADVGAIAASENQVTNGATAATSDTAALATTVTAAEAAKAAQAKLPEDQIPVFQKKTDTKQAGGSGFFRIFMTLGVLAVACGSAAYGLNRWSKKAANKNIKNTRIKVITSHHLGPKKNLTIVQVAGETILLGVTDQNITMLKTLSLLDDEIPESVPQRFDHSMDDFMSNDEIDEQEDEPIAMRGLNEIRDTVSSRLKNMRNL